MLQRALLVDGKHNGDGREGSILALRSLLH